MLQVWQEEKEKGVRQNIGTENPVESKAASDLRASLNEKQTSPPPPSSLSLSSMIDDTALVKDIPETFPHRKRRAYLQKKRHAIVKDRGLAIREKRVEGNRVAGGMTCHLTDVPQQPSPWQVPSLNLASKNQT